MMFVRIIVRVILYLMLFAVPVLHAADGSNVIHISTTTSTANSGLMNHLIEAFEQSTDYKIELTANGTGRALRLAREGKADLLIAHAPEAEEKFMQDGHGDERQYLMKNQFIIVGPRDDPAGISQLKRADLALRTIAEQQATFISRGDDSGTHKKELGLWKLANTDPYGEWYYEVGLGMGASLIEADKNSAYILTDSGTWLAKRSELSLTVLLSGDPQLDNPYHIITVDQDDHPSVNLEGANVFFRWILSDQGQNIIRNFTVDNERLFTPAK